MHHSRIEQFLFILRLFLYCKIAVSGESPCTFSFGCPGPTTLVCTCQPPEGEPGACESDPCQNGGTCTNEVVGFICQCPQDYTGERCESVASCDFFAVYLNGKGNFLNSAGEVTKTVNLLSDYGNRVAYDGNGRIFYSTVASADQSVYVYDTSYPLPQEAQLATFDGLTAGIAVDPQLKVVFVAMGNIGIESINYQGEDRRTVATLTDLGANDLTLDADTKDLFFANYNMNRIGKVNYLDLNNPGEAIILKSGFPSNPRGLITDRTAQRLYILLDNAEIWSLNLLDHTDLGPIVSAPSTQTNGFELAVCGGDLYYTDTNANTIWKIPKSETDGDEREPFNLSGVGTLRGITTI